MLQKSISCCAANSEIVRYQSQISARGPPTRVSITREHSFFFIAEKKRGPRKKEKNLGEYLQTFFHSPMAMGSLKELLEIHISNRQVGLSKLCAANEIVQHSILAGNGESQRADLKSAPKEIPRK